MCKFTQRRDPETVHEPLETPPCQSLPARPRFQSFFLLMSTPHCPACPHLAVWVPRFEVLPRGRSGMEKGSGSCSPNPCWQGPSTQEEEGETRWTEPGPQGPTGLGLV